MRDVRLEHLLSVLWLVFGEVQPGAQRPAAALQAGMQLVYVSDGVDPDPWVVERYALALVTATAGRFEVPDSSAPAGWRTERVFALRAIQGLSPRPN